MREGVKIFSGSQNSKRVISNVLFPVGFRITAFDLL